MKQIVLEKPERFSAATAKAPVPKEGEALVRIHRIGICGTDLHAFDGRQPFFSYPRILGHELGVEVLESPSDNHGLKPGDRCAVEPYLSCGQCHACKQNKPNCCENLQVLGVHTDGGMRGLMAVPVERLYASSRLSFDQLALVETLSIGQHAVERSGLEQGQTALIVGAGPIGISVAQFAAGTGAQLRVIDVSGSRREYVRRLGVETLAEPDGRLYDVVFDATGNANAMEASIYHVAHGGKYVLVGLVQGHIRFEDPLLHRREITILASRNSAYAFPRIIRMIEEGTIDTSPWITHRISLVHVPERFPGLRQQAGLVKAMIEVNDDAV
jgi:2-desacetyl-2-hydroxyethyl bacteriochlorophyllide A dehydrogenase